MRETQEDSDFGKAALMHIDSLWQTALWFTNNEFDAENLLISVYVEASACWAALLFNNECKTWLFKILIKKLFESNRSYHRAQFLGNFENEYETIPPESIDTLEVIPADMMGDAIRNLPLVNRLVIVLSIYGKFTYPEIADIIGVHRKVVRSKIHQGYVLTQRSFSIKLQR